MTAEELYNSLKAALAYLNVPWGDMDKVDVCLLNGQLVFSNGRRQATVELPSKEVAK